MIDRALSNPQSTCFNPVSMRTEYHPIGLWSPRRPFRHAACGIVTALLAATHAAAGDEAAPAQLSILRDGLVIASVEESIADRAWRITAGRTREPTQFERQHYDRERNEETLRMIRDLGVTLVLVPYGGYGPDAEEDDERRSARETLARCRELGLRGGVWLPVGRIEPDRWRESDPNIDARLVRNANGSPVPTTVKGRFLESIAHAESLPRWRRLAREAVEIAGAEALFLHDFQFVLNYEQPAVRCFRDYLTRSFPTADPRLSRWLKALDDGGLPTSPDSNLMQPWIACRADALKTALDEIAAEARRAPRDPDAPPLFIGVETISLLDQISIPGGPVVEHAALLPGADAVVSQQLVYVSEKGRVTHQIVEYKQAVACGARVIARASSPLILAQQLAFGGDSSGIVLNFTDGWFAADPDGKKPIDAHTFALVHFYRRHRELYADMRPVADVTLLRPKNARLFTTGPLHVLQRQTASALVTHRIPFDFHFDAPAGLPAAPHSHDSVVLIAGVPSFKRDEADALRRHLLAGGACLLIGDTTLEDGGTDKPEPPPSVNLADHLLSSGAGKRSPPSTQPATRPATTQPDDSLAPTIHDVGAGRLVILDRPGPPLNVWLTTLADGRARFSPPLEDDAFAAAVRAALGRPLSVEAKFDRGTAVELTRSADGDRLALHVVNFNRRTPLAETTVTVRVGDAERVRRVQRYVPQQGESPPEPIACEFTRSGDAVTFTTGPVDLYEVYLVESAR
jgi:hypothetical protein